MCYRVPSSLIHSRPLIGTGWSWFVQHVSSLCLCSMAFRSVNLLLITKPRHRSTKVSLKTTVVIHVLYYSLNYFGDNLSYNYCTTIFIKFTFELHSGVLATVTAL